MGSFSLTAIWQDDVPLMRANRDVIVTSSFDIPQQDTSAPSTPVKQKGQ